MRLEAARVLSHFPTVNAPEFGWIEVEEQPVPMHVRLAAAVRRSS